MAYDPASLDAAFAALAAFDWGADAAAFAPIDAAVIAAHGDAAARADVEKRLGGKDPERAAAPDLVVLTADADEAVRLAALKAVAKLGSPDQLFRAGRAGRAVQAGQDLGTQEGLIQPPVLTPGAFLPMKAPRRKPGDSLPIQAPRRKPGDSAGRFGIDAVLIPLLAHGGFY
jgi:hypothetical protein